MPFSTLSKHKSFFTHHNFYKNESSAIYFSHTLRIFGLSNIGLFLPIFLYQYFSDSFGGDFAFSVSLLLLFFAFESLITFLVIYLLADKILKKLHLKYMLLFSNLLLVTGLTLLFFSNALSPASVFLTAIIFGLVNFFYFVPFHLFFIEKNGNKDGHYGKKLGLNDFFAKNVEAVGPLLGGFIALNLGFNYLFAFSSLIIVLSSIPIFTLSETKHIIKPASVALKQFLFNKKYHLATLSILGVTMDMVVFMIFWPLLLFFTLKNTESMGVLVFLTMVLSSFMYLFAGKITDGKKGEVFHFFGVIIASAFHLLRIFIYSPVSAFMVDLLDKLNVFFDLPYNAKTYEIAKKTNDVLFIFYRQQVLYFSRFLVAVFLIVFINLFSMWKLVFIIASVGSLLSFLIIYTNTNKKIRIFGRTY